MSDVGCGIRHPSPATNTDHPATCILKELLMTPKPGIQTSEFWLTAVTNICGAIVALLAGYGLISREEGELWLALAQALALAVIPLALAYTNGRYIEGRTIVKSRAGSPRLFDGERTLADELWANDHGLSSVE
jgi:membrane protein DedA with SNARE-associated domain